DSLVFHANDNAIRSVVTLQHDKKELHATFTGNPVHYRYVNEEYMGITLYDQNGNTKKRVTAEGQETSKKFAEQVSGMQFEYGDVVKVFRAEPDRLKWYQNNR
ncbi:putative mucin/carbohydrate-binding domain-containing protein, partial [Bacillus cereus group sp. Bce025]